MINKCELVKEESNNITLLPIQYKQAWRENFALLLSYVKQIVYSRKMEEKIATN